MQPSPSFTFRNLTTQEISAIIKSITTKSTCGYNGISTKLLKVSREYITSTLTFFCNKVILTGIFSDRLKFSILKPVFKKGDKMYLKHYGPLSILTYFSKFFHKALYRRLTDYFDTNKLLVTNQYGFQKGQRTDDAIFKLINEIVESLNNKIKTGSIFLRFKERISLSKPQLTTG
jgi:hypothetical protein